MVSSSDSVLKFFVQAKVLKLLASTTIGETSSYIGDLILADYIKKNRCVVAFLGGGTASGKSFIAEQVVNKLTEHDIRVLHLSTDDYVINSRSERRQREIEILTKAEKLNCGSRIDFLSRSLSDAKYDFSLLRRILQCAVEGTNLPPGSVRTFNPSTGFSVQSEIKINRPDIIFIEGDMQVTNIKYDISFYLHASDSLRKSRFIERNVAERGYTVIEATRKFTDIQIGQHIALTLPLLCEADYLLEFDGLGYWLFGRHNSHDEHDNILQIARDHLMGRVHEKTANTRDVIHLLNTEAWLCYVWLHLMDSEPAIYVRLAALFHDIDRYLGLKGAEPIEFIQKYSYILDNINDKYKRNKTLHSLWSADLAGLEMKEHLSLNDDVLIDCATELIATMEAEGSIPTNTHTKELLAQADSISFFHKNLEHYKRTRNTEETQNKIKFMRCRLSSKTLHLPEVKEILQNACELLASNANDWGL